MKHFLSATILLLLLMLFCSASKGPVTVFTIGDSTMATKGESDNPFERGWGQYLQYFFDHDKVIVDNHAKNGRSTLSFINEGRWKTILDKLQPGDYVFIQFGHNDQKSQATAAQGGYRDNLIRYIRETREKGATPVLMTPIVRRRWSETGTLTDTHGEYPAVVREVGAEMRVPVIDMQQKTQELMLSLGVEGSKKLHLFLPAGMLTKYPAGVEDNTHLNDYGARKYASMAAEGIRESRLPIRKYLIPLYVE